MTDARHSPSMLAVFVATVISTAGLASVADAQPPDDSIQRIRALYEGALYEEAMRLLDASESVSSPIVTDQNQTLLQYRALCLLALDRQNDAEKTVEQILGADPMLQPAPEAPPRLLTIFARVRTRIVPPIAREQYDAAKTQYDNGRFADAAGGFDRVVQLTASVARGERDEMADLATLARGFLDLSRARTAPAGGDAAAAANRVFSSLDQDVVPPVAIRQEMPPWRPPARRAIADGSTNGRLGRLDIVIGPTGDVQEVVIATPVDPRYDAALVRAAKAWKYQPATKDGVAVSYRRTVIVRLIPTEGSGPGASPDIARTHPLTSP